MTDKRSVQGATAKRAEGLTLLWDRNRSEKGKVAQRMKCLTRVWKEKEVFFT